MKNNYHFLNILIIIIIIIQKDTAATSSTVIDDDDNNNNIKNNLYLNLLNDKYSTSLNARCLDGSPPAYYINKPQVNSINASKYIIYFQGGGWCYTVEECFARSITSIGSSKSYEKIITSDSKGGIINSNETSNPNFHSWTRVWVPYCDGTSWSGNLNKPIVNKNNKTIHYRGRANMIALVTALRRDQGMNNATSVIIDGGSAGGLTVLLHSDFFGSLLPKHVLNNYAAIGDAGWFRPDMKLDKVGYTNEMETMVKLSNASMDIDCLNHYNTDADKSKCIFAPIVFPFITTKMFILEGRYDSWQLHHILGWYCATYGKTLDNCTKNDNATLELYGTAMKKSIQLALKSSSHHANTAGAFVSQCIIHVQSVFNENHDVWNNQLVINGKTPHDVVSEWYFGTTISSRSSSATTNNKSIDDSNNIDGNGIEIEDCGDFGCNVFCQSYT